MLFLETVDSYCSIDNWPSEAERGVIFQLMTEASLHDDTLMRILVIGLTRELPLPPNDALDIADKLVARAANVHTIGTYIYLFVFVNVTFFFSKIFPEYLHWIGKNCLMLCLMSLDIVPHHQ